MEGEWELVQSIKWCAIFNDREWTQTLFSRSHLSLMLNISQMAKDMAIVTIEGE